MCTCVRTRVRVHVIDYTGEFVIVLLSTVDSMIQWCLITFFLTDCVNYLYIGDTSAELIKDYLITSL